MLKRFLLFRQGALATAIRPPADRSDPASRLFYIFLRSLSASSGSERGGSYAHTASSVPFLTQTVGQVVRQAADRHPDRLALVSCHQDIRRTYAQLYKEVEDLAAGLLALGLKKGDRVGIWGPNSHQWVLTQFATARAGLILVTINPAYQAKELEYCLKMVQCKAVVTATSFKTQNYYELIQSVSPDLEQAPDKKLNLSNLPDLKTIVLTEEDQKPGTWTFREMLAEARQEHFQALDRVQPQFDDPINIQFTSGTTGHPKAATLSHFNIVNNAYLVGVRIGYDRKTPTVCMTVPLYHCFGTIVGTLNIFLHGGTCILPAPSFQAEPSMRAIHRERCTMVYGTPTMYVDMLNLPDLHGYDCSQLESGIMSGASCPVELIRKVQEKLGIRDIFIPYGCTETSPVCTLTAPEDPEVKKSTTVGRPLDNIEVKVMSDEGKVVRTGELGQVCLRGFATFLGYWGQEDKTKEILKPDKWYLTGDLGRMDQDGFLSITGRIKEMIIRGGENIYPREIEEFLLTHPRIADVHVCGVPDPRMGEEVCAWVATAEDGQGELDQEQIRIFCKGKISHFKIPRYFVFTKEFPKTVTGKVQKFRMKEQSIKFLKLK